MSSIAGTVQHWANVNENGTMVASSRGGRSSLINSLKATYSVAWSSALPSRCIPMVTGELFPKVGHAGWGAAYIDTQAKRVVVRTFDSGNSGPRRHAFYVVVICP